MIFLVLLFVGAGAFRLPEDMPVDYSGYKTLRVAIGSEEAKKLILLMVETEVISIMDEGLGHQIDVLDHAIQSVHTSCRFLRDTHASRRHLVPLVSFTSKRGSCMNLGREDIACAPPKISSEALPCF